MLRLIGVLWLKVFGWRWAGGPTVPKQYVLIAAPHTSNWDLPFTLALGWSQRMKVTWVGKHTLFEGSMGWFFRWLGGYPVDRRSSHNVVETIADIFSSGEPLVLVIAPEGTRSLRDYWKSGFYFIAHTAKVPIGCGYLDFARKKGGIGALIEPTGDVRADMDKIRAFYADKTGHTPEKQGPIRLRAEDDEPEGAAPQAPSAPESLPEAAVGG